MSDTTEVTAVTDMALAAWLLARGIAFAAVPAVVNNQVEFRFQINASRFREMQSSFALSAERRFFSTYLDVKRIVNEVKQIARGG